MSAPQSILITGASSGLGEALAHAYAAPGVTLFLSGRDATRLETVANQCRQRGALALPRVLDVTRREDMAAWIAECDIVHPLELVIANAGIAAGNGASGETAQECRHVFSVNIDGVANTIWPAIEHMRPRQAGQIAIMSSLASFRGLPGAPAYCASKAAVRVWGEGLRGQLAADGIAVSVICPGFVESRITARNTCPMPFLMDAERAAKIMVAGLARRKGRIAYPWPMAALAWATAALPDGVMDWIGRKLPGKN